VAGTLDGLGRAVKALDDAVVRPSQASEIVGTLTIPRAFPVVERARRHRSAWHRGQRHV